MLAAVLFAVAGVLAPTSLTAMPAVHAGPPGDPGLPIVSPTRVGMSPERLAEINRVVQRGISAGGFPGATVVVGRKGKSVLQEGYGHLSWSPDSPAANARNTIYDLASLTKVVGTTTAIMVLYDQGRVALDAPVSRYLPEFSGGEKDRVTVRQLLLHRSGLPAGRDIWKITHDPAEAKRVILSTPLEYSPGTRYVYSDLGADVLGMIVEAVSAQPLDEFLADYVFHPLGMYDTGFKPADSLKARIAPTEVDPPRGYPLQGEVHDENAFAMGGVAGHAGLFSTATDLSIFAQMMLNGGVYNGVRIVADSTVALFTRRARDDSHRALGWDTPSGSYGSGNFLSEDAFGHTGYTGTSMWIDPDRDMFVILLTNRVHEARAAHPAQVIGDVRSDLSDVASLAVTDMPDGPLAMPTAFRSVRQVGWNNTERSRRRGARGRARHAKSLSSRHGKRSRTVHSAAGKSRHSSSKAHAKPHKSRRKSG